MDRIACLRMTQEERERLERELRERNENSRRDAAAKGGRR